MHSHSSLNGSYIGYFFGLRTVKFLHSYYFSYVCCWPFIQLHLQLQYRIILNEFIVDSALRANLNSLGDSSEEPDEQTDETRDLSIMLSFYTLHVRNLYELVLYLLAIHIRFALYPPHPRCFISVNNLLTKLMVRHPVNNNHLKFPVRDINILCALPSMIIT